MPVQYFRMVHQYKGHHYFKVTGEMNDVVKITFGVQPKRGRPYCPGITLIKYTTYLSNYAWYSEHETKSKNCTLVEIKQEEYDKAKKLITKKLGIYDR